MRSGRCEAGHAVPEGMRVARSIQQQEHSLGGDAMLPAVAFSAERLLLAPDWAEAIDEVLMHLGIAADVSRAYLIRVDRTGQGVYTATQLAEWCAPGVTSQFDNPTLQGAPSRRPASPGGSSVMSDARDPLRQRP